MNRRRLSAIDGPEAAPARLPRPSTLTVTGGIASDSAAIGALPYREPQRAPDFVVVRQRLWPGFVPPAVLRPLWDAVFVSSISMDGETLRARDDWGTPEGSHVIRVAEVERPFCRERRNGKYRAYTVNVVLKDGTREPLLTLGTPAEALFIQQCIEDRLAFGDTASSDEPAAQSARVADSEDSSSSTS